MYALVIILHCVAVLLNFSFRYILYFFPQYKCCFFILYEKPFFVCDKKFVYYSYRVFFLGPSEAGPKKVKVIVNGKGAASGDYTFQ